MITENTNELNDLDNHITNVINQFKKWRKTADVDTVLKIIRINDCVNIKIDFLAACLNSLLEHNVIVKKQVELFSLNENEPTLDLIEILRSCTHDIPIPNASIDTNKVEIKATLEDSPNISTIDTPTCSNLPYSSPSQPYSLKSLKQNYLDLRAQSVDVKEFLFREICSLKNKVTSYKQQMGHIMSNFGNINYETELELKVSLLEKKNVQVRGHLIDKMMITKQLKTYSKSYPFTTDASTTTSTITTPAQTYDNINSNNDNNYNDNNNNSINKNNCKNKAKDNNNNKNNKIRNTIKTIIALMKMLFATKNVKHNCRKFETNNVNIF